MIQPPRFNSFEEAETKIKDQVISLCNSYADTIQQVLPTLKRAASEKSMIKKDQKVFSDLYNEGNDHLHNLTQLKVELNELKKNQGVILEVSAEVLANTVKYLNSLPASIQNTTIESN
tara:strand:- start:5195 stop:5548 length:354 start_codon:yes stop_codon:yes gene_type:complete